jgi:outer membrane receptor protein involved in Fe transport
VATKRFIAPLIFALGRIARADDAEEVRVRGVKPEPVRTTVSSEDVRQMPGAFGDPFRFIEALPGVTPIVSGIPFFFVRGAPPGNVGYFLDGVRVPLLYHLALGPSVIHPGLVDKVEFYPGGYPARYGRFAGGIVAGETKAPRPKAHGEGSIRLIDAGMLAEAPFFNGRVTALVGGRVSYTGALVSLFAPDTRVNYADYQGRIVARLTDKDAVSVFAFGSFDELLSRDRPNNPNGTKGVTDFYPLFRTVFHRIDVRHDHALAHGRIRTAVTLGADASAAGSRSNTTEVGTTSVGVRNEIELRLDRDARFRAGADATVTDFTLGSRDGMGRPITNPSAAGLYPPRQEVMLGAHAEVAFRPWPRVEIAPGLRIDLYDAHSWTPSFRPRTGTFIGGAGEIAVEPRLQTRVQVTNGVAYLSTFGVAHQPPSFVVPVPGLSIGRLNHGLQTAVQASQGLEFLLPLDFTLTATGFLHAYTGLTDATATCVNLNGSTGDIVRECLEQRVRGRSFGLEVLLRRPLTKRLTGWLSYTLSRSTRDTSGLTIIGRRPIGEGEMLADFDRTHVLALIGAYDLGAGWRVGARLQYYTGRPYSKTFASEFVRLPLPPYNAERMPDFARLDLRVEKAWRVLKTGRLSVVFEWLNATLAPETVGVDSCEPNGPFNPVNASAITCTFKSIGPVTVPSIGVDGEL